MLCSNHTKNHKGFTMFKALSAVLKRGPVIDPLAAETSRASQENTAAACRLREAMDRVLNDVHPGKIAVMKNGH